MPSRARQQPLLAAESRQFWRESFVAALRVILAEHDGEQLTETAAAHLAADIADEALTEYGRRFGRPT